MIGFAILTLAIGTIMGFVSKKNKGDAIDEVVEESEPVYDNDSHIDDELTSDEEMNEDNELTLEELEEEVMTHLEEIDEVEDNSFIDYDVEYDTVFSSNEKFGEKTVTSAIKSMHDVIALQFKKDGSHVDDWKSLVTERFMKEIESGNVESVMYSNSSEVIEIQSVPVESKSDELILGGVVTTLKDGMYLHEYSFVESEGETLLDDIRFIWKY